MVQHVHIKCDPNFINYLFGLAEPELNGDTQEKHAKNIEIAKKEVLTCIGITLFDRSVRIFKTIHIIPSSYPNCLRGTDVISTGLPGSS